MPSSAAYSDEVKTQAPARFIVLNAFIRSGSASGFLISRSPCISSPHGRERYHAQGYEIIRFFLVTVRMDSAVSAGFPWNQALGFRDATRAKLAYRLADSSAFSDCVWARCARKAFS